MNSFLFHLFHKTKGFQGRLVLCKNVPPHYQDSLGINMDNSQSSEPLEKVIGGNDHEKQISVMIQLMKNMNLS